MELLHQLLVKRIITNIKSLSFKPPSIKHNAVTIGSNLTYSKYLNDAFESVANNSSSVLSPLSSIAFTPLDKGSDIF